MKIAVVGCGALGSFYGAKLCRAGHDVHFLLRSDYNTVRQHGVRIESVEGHFTVHPHAARQPSDIGASDLVLIGLKTTANAAFPNLIPPLVGNHTRVVTLQNGMGNEESLAALVNPNNLLGGLCFVCLNRIAPGVVRHTAHGFIVLGEFQRAPLPRTEQLAQLLRDATIECRLTDDLERAHWEKLVWNIPFNGLGVAGTVGYDAVIRGQVHPNASPTPCLTTDQLLGTPHWQSLVRELMLEVVQTANALGFPLPPSLADVNIERTLTMGAYKASTLVDFERGQPLEVDSLFSEPLHRAQAAGIDTPRLQALTQVLRTLDQRTQGNPPHSPRSCP